MSVRFAEENELERVNELRKQVNDLHVSGRPDIFRAGFPDELRGLLFAFYRDPLYRIVVAERGGVICGFALLHRIDVPETPFKRERSFLDIDEFGVDEAYRRQGVASEMIAFIRSYARDEGFDRLELNMWEFNWSALAFYESVGFETYRRYMEMKL